MASSTSRPPGCTSTAAGGAARSPAQSSATMEAASAGTERSSRLRSLPCADFEAEQVAFFRPVQGAEAMAPQARRPRLAAPDGGGGAIAEKAGAHQHAMVVIEIKRGRANFHRHAGDHRLRPGGQQVTGRPQHRNRRPAAQAHQIVQDGVAPQSELFGDITGHAWTKVAGAGAEKSASSCSARRSACCQRLAQGFAGQARRLAAKRGVQFVLGQVEDLLDVALPRNGASRCRCRRSGWSAG